MPGRNERNVETVVVEGAAGIAGIDILHALPRQIRGELEDRYQRRRVLLAGGDGIAGMVVVAMGERDMGHAFDRLAHGYAGIFESRIAVEKWIDQKPALAGIHPKAGMTEPRKLHNTLPSHVRADYR